MEREQVIKALECCTGEDSKCADCPRLGFLPCTKPLMKDALSLIKELTEGVEGWKEIAEGYQKQFEDCYDKAQKDWEGYIKTAELLYDAEQRCAKLTEENERLRTSYETVAKLWAKSKADTVRKMQERLKETKFKMLGYELIYAENIDQIAKEMIEGETK